MLKLKEVNEIIEKCSKMYELIVQYQFGKISPHYIREKLIETIQLLMSYFSLNLSIDIDSLSISELIMLFDFLAHRLHQIVKCEFH